MIANPVFDTDVWIQHGYNFSEVEKVVFALPLVVYCEIVASKIRPETKQTLDAFVIRKNNQGLLLSLNLEDWSSTANLIWKMRHNGERLDVSGTALQNDIIICRSVMRWNNEDYDS